MNEVELKPCPFCGGDKIDFRQRINQDVVPHFFSILTYIFCHKCGIRIDNKIFYSTKASPRKSINETADHAANELIEKWNTRVGE